jgi:hypothetical protein
LPPARPSFRRWLWPLYQRICGRSDAPILVGPWRGEVGFEVLYWLPFLEQLRHAYQIPPARLIPITRGGAGAWYGTPSAVELYAMRTPQEVRVENRLQHQRTGMLKQMHVTAWDRQVLRDAAQTLGLTRYHVLHPAWMYQALQTFWEGQHGLGWLQSRTRFAPLPAPALEGVTLPERFAAVRFYFRATFPASPIATSFAKHTIALLAQQQPVIILNNGLHLDDHFDYLPKDRTNITLLSDLVNLTPENNLAWQSAILSRALGFVGTYGGLAQLALRLGKPTVSVYQDWHGTALPHRHLSEALALQMGVGFHVLRIADLPLIQTVLPKVLAQK